MKSQTYIQLAISALSLLTAPAAANACGPYQPIIPTPEFFGTREYETSISTIERQENNRLWQKSTSMAIPIADIDEAVYRMSIDAFYDRLHLGNPTPTNNRFITYLKNTNDKEVINFILLAKRLEKAREKNASPWYYPQSRYSDGYQGDYEDVLEQCHNYRGTRLADRYGLQAVRALYASRQWAECIEYYDSVFATIPDSNLLKRMSSSYVAGCWHRLGETGRADTLFAQAGDIKSLSCHNPVEFMARLNPNAQSLIEHLRRQASDSAYMVSVFPLAKQLSRDPRVTHKADWHFLAAYIAGEYLNRPTEARQHINQALRQKFSTQKLNDLARAYGMKIKGRIGNRDGLLADLKWISSKITSTDPETKEWIRRLQNIVYSEWIPRLWREGDYSLAILLCSHAENVVPEGFRVSIYDDDPEEWPYWCRPIYSVIKKKNDEPSYGSLSSQLMGSLTSGGLAATYRSIFSSNPIYKYLRGFANTDKNYWNEMIGTLALREENYARAVNHLSKVSINYQHSMPIYRDGYLSRDPFALDPMAPTSKVDGDNAKLRFARRMLEYQRTILSRRSGDERGHAMLMYALGRLNSFERCWALTQYWRGFTGSVFEPLLDYYDYDFPEKNYSFLYQYEGNDWSWDSDYDRGTTDSEAAYELFNTQKDKALAMMTTDEARAKAHYILGNLKTIVRRYPSTATAAAVKSSCDNWRHWL